MTIHPLNVTIDGNSEDITLKKNEFIEIIQYSDTGYAIISEKRMTSDYILMNLNLEDSIVTSYKT
jgi:hypothetical protein